ncbi:nucleotidyltransferase family protein [Rhodococcus sp. 27YEA15]|uniref:nucleotidyltransferase family protein n=1 Tax=Rhodococcus sp. 27YEA15 TaxID=3156259 RepID=UPI003C7CDE7F
MCAVVLAAGAGSRMGMPKALVHDADGRSWLRHAVSVLRDAHFCPVIVVLGARAEEARSILAPGNSDVIVVESDWRVGVSSSIRCGLDAALDLPDVDAVAVTVVDVPDLNVATVERVVTADAVNADTLRRAVFNTEPGHPVIIGRNHWRNLIATLTGDRGAGAYLRENGVVAVECADLSTGLDVDYPAT